MPDPAPQNDALRRALDEALRLRSQNTQLEQQRDAALMQARGEATSRVAAEETAIDNAIAVTETERNSLQNELTRLQEEGKFGEASAIVAKMTDASARLQTYRQQKEQVAGRREQIASQPAAAPNGQQQSDPLAGLSERERAWVETNPRYRDDAAFRQRAAAAAGYAINVEGIERDSDDYFDFINQRLNPSAGNGAGSQQPQKNGAADGGTVLQDPPGPVEPPAIRIDPGAMAGGSPFSSGAAPTRAQMDDGSLANETQMVDQMFPQQRAVGNGGDGIRQVAAPPTRRIFDLARQHSGGRTIDATMEELETARTLARDIDPELYGRGSDQEIVAWYYNLYNSPSSKRKLRRWYGNAA